MRYIALLLLISSCSNTLYVPSTRNAPLFREQGEAQISAYYGSGGIEAQGAFAFTDHIAVIGSYSYLSSQETNPNNKSTNYDRKNSYAEIGLGLFDRSRALRYEIFAGYGIGQGTTADQYSFYGLNTTVIATGKMSKYFVQPTVGTNNRDFNLAFSPRFSWVDYYEFSDPIQGTKKPNLKIQMFIEPAVTAKFRLTGNIHGIFQLGMALPLPDETNFKYSALQTSLGIQIDTGGLRTKVY